MFVYTSNHQRSQLWHSLFYVAVVFCCPVSSPAFAPFLRLTFLLSYFLFNFIDSFFLHFCFQHFSQCFGTFSSLFWQVCFHVFHHSLHAGLYSAAVCYVASRGTDLSLGIPPTVGGSLWSLGLGSAALSPPAPGRLHRSISWAGTVHHVCPFYLIRTCLL